MNERQEETVEALSLQDGGFAAVRGQQIVVNTSKGGYLVDGAGDVFRFQVGESWSYAALQRRVYGAGALR